MPYSECDTSHSVDDRVLHEDRFPWLEGLSQVHLLSERELQVFSLLSHGYSNREIAALLGVTERTVKAHMAQILAKLRVESRLQAGLVAFAHGLAALTGDSPPVPGSPPRCRSAVPAIDELPCTARGFRRYARASPGTSSSTVRRKAAASRSCPSWPKCSGSRCGGSTYRWAVSGPARLGPWT